MNITAHPELLDLLAASHAVGTLRGGARRRFEAIAREQPAVRAIALLWQGRLANMVELQTPVAPDPAVWVRIRNMIDAEHAAQAQAQAQAQRTTSTARNPTRVPTVLAGWRRSLWLWRSTTLAGALATVLAVVVGVDLKRQLDTAPSVQYVAVLADDKAAPSMLVTFDPKNRQLVMQRVGNFRESPDKSLQLWALPPGAAPRSLGVLGNGPAIKLTAAASEVRAVPTLAITLEPRGGVPAGSGPTGPVLFHGALIEKML